MKNEFVFTKNRSFAFETKGMYTKISVVYCNTLKLIRLFESSFIWGGCNLTPNSPTFLFQEELMEYQYNFMELLNNLFKIA